MADLWQFLYKLMENPEQVMNELLFDNPAEAFLI